MAKTREEKIIESNRLIECTGCPGVQSAFVSKTPRVFVKKQPIGTLNDIKPSDNIINFSGTCLFNFKPCLYAPDGTWQKSRETIAAKKQQPLTEISSYLKCAQGGEITFVKTADAWEPPENIVDKAQSKINSAVNYVTKKVTEVAQAASDAIGSISDAAKKAGSILKNESVSNALKGASDFVDDVDRQKAGLDVTVANLDIRLNNLRKELKQLVTGQQQDLKDLMTVEDVGQTKNNTTTTSKKEKSEEEKEKEFNQEYFNKENKKAVNEFLTGIDNDINTANGNASRINTTKDFTISVDEDSADSTRLFTNPPPPQIAKNNIVTNTTNQTPKIIDQIDQANNELKKYGATAIDAQSKARVKQSLALLNDLSSVISKGGITTGNIINTPTVSETINVVRDDINTLIEAEIDEVLKEIKYAERLKKYNDESKDVQKDLDKASAALDILGDFDAFIDGIAGKHLGRLVDKYKETFNKLGKNMALLNTSMQGLSYMAGGFPAGDVVTNVPVPENNNGENEDEDGNGDGNGALAGNIFGSLQDVLDDRNEEPRILRIFAVYAEDPKEGEEHTKGAILETISILPDIKVNLIIQANGMADGSIVDLDLQERSFHYEPLNTSGSTTTRPGLFENLVLNGASPDFENGEAYDLTDPNYALDANGNRKADPLEDKTTLEFISRLPVEEEEEEPLTAV